MSSEPKNPTTKALMGTGKANNRGVIQYEINSQSRKGVKHIVAAQVETGRVHCNCEDFRYRCADHKPTIGFGPVCKHISSFRKSIMADLLANAQPSLQDMVREDCEVVDINGQFQWTRKSRAA